MVQVAHEAGALRSRVLIPDPERQIFAAADRDSASVPPSDMDACWPSRLADAPHRDWFSSALRVDDLKTALRILKARHNIPVRVSALLA